jgi:hypothetical protein
MDTDKAVARLVKAKADLWSSIALLANVIAIVGSFVLVQWLLAL